MSTAEKSAKPFRIISPLTIGVGVVGLAIVGWLAFGFFGVQTLFTDTVVEEAGPTFGSAAATPASEAEDTSSNEGTPATVAATDGAAAAPTTTAPTEPQIVTLAAGDFVDLDHPTAGVASVLTDGSSQRFLRFEDFETDNGPDLNVYLSTADPSGDLGADFVDLGDLKGNQGSQNYEIPTDVDLSVYKTVVIWCVRFGVPFGAAPLA